MIDEYDVPLAKAYENGYYEQMVFLIRNLFDQVLKGTVKFKVCRVDRMYAYFQRKHLYRIEQFAACCLFPMLNLMNTLVLQMKRYKNFFLINTECTDKYSRREKNGMRRL